MSEGDPSEHGRLAEAMAGPAAHSMDTDWFALDALGHVGLFESGEGGGVPHGVVPGVWVDDLLVRLLREPARVGVRFDDHEVFEPDPRAADHWRHYSIFDAPEQLDGRDLSALVELEHPRMLADPRLRAGLVGDVPLGRLPCDRVLVHGWFRPGVLAQLWRALGVVRVREPYYPEAGRLGVFQYSCDDYSAGPYARVEAPRGQPLRIEQLSAPLRSTLSGVTFSALDFRDAARVQPFEHMPSHAWGNEWLGSDGEMHPVE